MKIKRKILKALDEWMYSILIFLFGVAVGYLLTIWFSFDCRTTGWC